MPCAQPFEPSGNDKLHFTGCTDAAIGYATILPLVLCQYTTILLKVLSAGARVQSQACVKAKSKPQ